MLAIRAAHAFDGVGSLAYQANSAGIARSPVARIASSC